MNEEYANMHLICGRAGGNGRLAQRMYQEQHPWRRYPHDTSVTDIDLRLRETEPLQITRCNVGQEENVRTPEIEIRVLQRYAVLPLASI